MPHTTLEAGHLAVVNSSSIVVQLVSYSLEHNAIRHWSISTLVFMISLVRF